MLLLKGTIVRHGTSLSRIGSIYKNGLLPSCERNLVREEQEASPIVNGIYVADNLSYYGAFAAFSSFMYEHNSNNSSLSDIPIVLQIKLGEDCRLLADEDYIKCSDFAAMERNEKLSLLEEQSENVWENYKTGVLADIVIPRKWIYKIEYPLLKNIHVLKNNSKYESLFNQDVMLLVLAYWQNKTQVTTREFYEMLDEYKLHNSYRPEFTNTEMFSLEAINKIKRTKIVKQKNKKYEYAMFLWVHLTERLNQLGLEYTK